MDGKVKQAWDRCEALLTECKLIGVHIVGMQSRLELDMPVTVDMELIKGCVEDLKKVVEVDSDG